MLRLNTENFNFRFVATKVRKFLGLVRGNRFESDDGCDQREDEKYAPKICGLLEDQDANQYGAHSTYARPYGVSGA